MKKCLLIVLLVGSWSCGGGINIFGNGSGNNDNSNQVSRAPGLIIYNSTNCNLWSGSIVTIFNNSSGYVSDEI